MKNLRLIFKNGIFADFKFVDNEVGQTMYKLISGVKESTEIKNYHGSFPLVEDPIEVEKRLRTLVDECTNLGLEMPWMPDVLDRDNLNRIHEAFHVIEESWIGKPDSEVHDKMPVRRKLNEINKLVHVLEKHVGEQVNDAWNGYSYAVFQIGQTHNHPPRQVLHSRLRKFWRQSERPGKVVLTCGYATIGKNLSHCQIDNDVELVKKNLLSPQMSVSTETIWVHSPNPISAERAEEMWQDHLSKIKKFVIENKLQDHVGYQDPIHTYTVPPVYATLIEDSLITKQTWSVKNWYNLFDKIGLERAELV